jgi:hypothetical protein
MRCLKRPLAAAFCFRARSAEIGEAWEKQQGEGCTEPTAAFGKRGASNVPKPAAPGDGARLSGNLPWLGKSGPDNRDDVLDLLPRLLPPDSE